MKLLIKGFIKYFFLAVVACIGAVIIYNVVVPKDSRIPISIEITK